MVDRDADRVATGAASPARPEWPVLQQPRPEVRPTPVAPVPGRDAPSGWRAPDATGGAHTVAGPSSGSVIRTVAQDPVYRSVFLILVVQGIVFGSVMPLMPLWAQDRLGAGSVEVGTISVVSSLVTTVFGLAYGMFTDRSRRRVAWLVAAYAAALPLRVALAYVTDLVLGAAMYAVTGMAMFVLYYAIIGDWLRLRRDPRSAEILNVVRLGFTFGWMAGAFGGGRMVSTIGYEGMFLATGALHAVSLAMLSLGVRDAPPPTEERSVGANDEVPIWRELARPAVRWYLVTSIFTGAASVARMALLPLYLREVVGAGPDEIGALFGVVPVYEIPVSLLAGLVVARLGVPRLMLAGIGTGVAYYCLVALTTSYMPFLVIEALFAILVTATFGFGLIHVQALMPRRGGTAVAAYNAAGSIGPVVAAPTLGWVADNLGWVPVYLGSAGIMALALLTMWLSYRASEAERLLALGREAGQQASPSHQGGRS